MKVFKVSYVEPFHVTVKWASFLEEAHLISHGKDMVSIEEVEVPTDLDKFVEWLNQNTNPY